MPHLKSAYKNLRKSRKIAEENRAIKASIKKLLKGPVTGKTLPAITKALDKAVKRKIYNPNKIARVKSGLAKRTAKK